MRKLDPEKFDRKREDILRAAERCFLREGLTAGSTTAICAEAGISPGHLYHYFENKSAIILALAESSLAQKTALISEAMATRKSVVGALEAIMDAYLEMATRPEPTLLFDVLAEAPRRSDVALSLREHSAQVHRLIVNLLAEGQRTAEIDADVDANIRAAAFLGLLDGLKALAVRGLNARSASVEMKRAFLHPLAATQARPKPPTSSRVRR